MTEQRWVCWECSGRSGEKTVFATYSYAPNPHCPHCGLLFPVEEEAVYDDRDRH